MSRRRILGWLVLAAAAVATSVSVWQAALWYGHSRDNDAIRNALAHESGDVTPQSPLPVLFAQGYAESKLDRYREAGAAYQTIWIRTDGGTRGDPEGLALALAKLERRQGAFWEDIFTPGRRSPDPSLLRTHPKTEERIARLMSLRPHGPRLDLPADPVPYRGVVPEVQRPPRWHRSGVWY